MTTKERLVELIEGLGEDEARALESLLEQWAERRDWDEAALASFAAHFEDEEVEYALADARPRPA
jgi:hypothetical protein